MNRILENPKLKKDDRVLVLKPMEGKKSVSSTGLTDPRLFTGENKMHIIKDPRTNTWSFKYDSGGVPEYFKQRFTTFQQALKHAKSHFDSRNVQIVEVID